MTQITLCHRETFQMHLTWCQVICTLIFLLPITPPVILGKLQSELDEEESQTFASRSDGRSRVVTGTFR